MPYTQEQHERRQLNHWAREWGYADFDTYLAAGGNFTDAFQRLRNLHDSVTMAIRSLQRRQAEGEAAAEPVPGAPVIGPEALARLEAENGGDDPVDPHNAQVQGDDHVA